MPSRSHPAKRKKRRPRRTSDTRIRSIISELETALKNGAHNSSSIRERVERLAQRTKDREPFKCPVCFEEESEGRRFAKVTLRCHEKHMLCFRCAVNNEIKTCPLCRENIPEKQAARAEEQRPARRPSSAHRLSILHIHNLFGSLAPVQQYSLVPAAELSGVPSLLDADDLITIPWSDLDESISEDRSDSDADADEHGLYSLHQACNELYGEPANGLVAA